MAFGGAGCRAFGDNLLPAGDIMTAGDDQRSMVTTILPRASREASLAMASAPRASG
jgi:hypothetical protein